MTSQSRYYCGPWQEDNPNFWTLRDECGAVFAIACSVKYGSVKYGVNGEYHDGVRDAFRQADLLSYIEYHGSVDKACFQE